MRFHSAFPSSQRRGKYDSIFPKSAAPLNKKPPKLFAERKSEEISPMSENVPEFGIHMRRASAPVLSLVIKNVSNMSKITTDSFSLTNCLLKVRELPLAEQDEAMEMLIVSFQESTISKPKKKLSPHPSEPELRIPHIHNPLPQPSEISPPLHLRSSPKLHVLPSLEETPVIENEGDDCFVYCRKQLNENLQDIPLPLVIRCRREADGDFTSIESSGKTLKISRSGKIGSISGIPLGNATKLKEKVKEESEAKGFNKVLKTKVIEWLENDTKMAFGLLADWIKSSSGI